MSRLKQSELATLELRAWFMLTGRLAGPDRLANLSHAELPRARRRSGPRRPAGWFRAGSRHGRRERLELEAAGVQSPFEQRVVVAMAAEQLPVPPGCLRDLQLPGEVGLLVVFADPAAGRQRRFVGVPVDDGKARRTTRAEQEP